MRAIVEVDSRLCNRSTASARCRAALVALLALVGAGGVIVAPVGEQRESKELMR